MFCPVVPTVPPTPASSSSVFLLAHAVLRNALGSQLGQHIVQVIGIRVAMAGEIRPKLCLVMDFIPDDSIGFTSGAGGTDGKDEATVPGYQEEFQDFSPFLTVRKITVSGEATGAETLPRVWMFWTLNARRNAIDDPDCFAVRVARQRVRDEVVLHLPWGLGACLHPINGLTGWTLQTPILVAIVVHGNQAVDVVDMAASGQLSHQIRLDGWLWALVTRVGCEPFHADGAILIRWVPYFLKIFLQHFFWRFTFLGLFLGGLAACVGDPRDGFYLTLADRWWMEDQLWWPGETHGQTRCTHEDASDSCQGRVDRTGAIEVLHWDSGDLFLLFTRQACSLLALSLPGCCSLQFQMSA